MCGRNISAISAVGCSIARVVYQFVQQRSHREFQFVHVSLHYSTLSVALDSWRLLHKPWHKSIASFQQFLVTYPTVSRKQ
jgi:hypothetical protein